VIPIPSEIAIVFLQVGFGMRFVISGSLSCSLIRSGLYCFLAWMHQITKNRGYLKGD